MKLGHLSLPADVCRVVGEVLDRVGDKWSILIIRLLTPGPLRFSQLKRDIGSISQKMLTSTLRNLERDGFVTRHVTPSVPPRVDYELTAMGRDVMVPMNALAEWALRHRGRVDRARRSYDVKQRRGARLSPS